MPSKPLAERVRPQSLDEVVGQDHLLGEGGALRRQLDQGQLPSIIFWGPPGVGKTTMALLLAEAVNRPLVTLSAVNSGVRDLRELTGRTGDLLPPVVFIDEIHRFNKSQQDALLPAVEKGQITLIGATTENPSFEVNRALLSRCQVYILESLTPEQQTQLLQQAIARDDQLKQRHIVLEQTDALFSIAGGDARKLLNLLELVVNTVPKDADVIVNDAQVMAVAQQHIAQYDKSGDQHYDVISAFIKSLRGSDPDGALYWLARMINAGEDPAFIARRMLILASEDIGNANPNALLLAGECFRAVQAIGYPECRLILSQTAVYLATSAKSNSTYEAINRAMSVAKRTAHLPVPLHLRNAPTSLMKEQGYGAGYLYAHHYENNFVPQTYLPPELQGSRFYQPSDNPREQEAERLQQQRRASRPAKKKRSQDD